MGDVVPLCCIYLSTRAKILQTCKKTKESKHINEEKLCFCEGGHLRQLELNNLLP